MMTPSFLRVLCWLALGLFLGYNGYEIIVNTPDGGFAAAFTTFLQNFWGRVVFFDLFVGLGIFAIWILFREKSLPRVLGWISLLLVLGNGGVLIYLLAALRPIHSSADWPRFFLGARHSENHP